MQPPVLIVAGLSSRMMAESAARAGLDVIALDLFGDADTRHAAMRWAPVGNPATLTLDADEMLVTLRRLRDHPRLLGWVAGTGFEEIPELLEAGAAIVPLLGNTPATVRAIKQPSTFFGMLDRLGIAHPETRTTPPEHNTADWLCKRIGGAGAWHIRLAGDAHNTDLPVYYQRRCTGVPMSALFIADANGVRIVGINRQWIGSRPDLPYVFEGAAGPVELPPQMTQRLHDAVHAIARESQLVGLNSIDFLFDAPECLILEVNPRPSASMTLYDDAYPLGLMHAHLQACQGATPLPLPQRNAQTDTVSCRGFRVVFSETSQHVDASLTAALLRTGWCHDIPVPGIRIGAREPLCTLSASGQSIAAADALLQERCQHIHDLLKAQHVEHRDATGILNF